MMRTIREKLNHYLFSDDLPLQGRMLNLICAFGFCAVAIATLAHVFEDSSPYAIYIMFAMMAIIVIVTWLFNKYRRYEFGSFLAVLAFGDILFPLLFYVTGGSNGGMAAHFVLGITLCFMLVQGKRLVFLVILQIAVVFACYLTNVFHPEIFPPLTDYQRYLDILQTILTSGLFIGFVLIFQMRIYRDEKKKATDAMKAKSEFLAGVSHEIRTPLNAIIGLGELEMRKDLPTDTLDNLAKMQNSGNTLLGIINDLLDISKIESGRFEMAPAEYDLPSMINDTVSLNIVRIGSKPIDFVLKLADDLPVRLFGDELRIKQILNNLLSNAFKYTREGKVTLSLEGRRDGDAFWLICRISDTGIGIRKEDIGRLFTEYNKLDMTSNRHIEGTGLGLSICKNLVEMMGGRIEVESVYGEGSVFTADMRQRLVTDAVIDRATAENLKSFNYNLERNKRSKNLILTQMPYGRVLVVDDVVTNLDVAKGILLPYGLTVDCVSSGREAVKLVRAGNPRYDLIFMDHMMPEMDGIETVRIIREEIGTDYAQKVPIIALTANALAGNDDMFKAHGFQDFLSKPIDIMKMDVALNAWIKNAAREKAYREASANGDESGAAEAAPAQARAAGEAQNGAAQKPKKALTEQGIEGLDIADALRRFGGKESIFITILRSFVNSMPALLDRFGVCDADGLSDYTITVHGIKGSCRNIGAKALGDEAEALETAAKAGDLDKIRAGTDALIAGVRRLIADIDAALNT
ncbi:MAG: response regulator [Clostridiales Family XIII bacterium]|jgi:signal transduction histidine kinase/DNA-binding response OmpR family regulator/HPt (histidine-containing phosphotransfer) domain-containing protein|nr:response regulator [Clostridiales Family XIII bacterium]